MQDVSNYEVLRENTNNFYKKLLAIRCPALHGELVHFAAEGLNHLMFKNRWHERSKNDQIMKLKLLPKA